MNSGLSDRDFCIQKVDSTIALVKRLLDGEYPHRDSTKALKKILSIYEDDRELLINIDTSSAERDTILEFCRRVNINLVRFKVFLGLLLRSSNLRNAFELYFPIKVLALELLGSPTAVVLSSEWSFSPFTYPIALPELPEFVFIGIPASECQNPLIMPLAAHELGHVVWRRKGAKQEFDSVIKERILKLYKDNWPEFSRRFGLNNLSPDRLEVDLFLRRLWGQSYRIAQRQLEEVFCDFIGIYVFGQSFLHSFRYLVAPSLGHTRSVLYPPLRERAKYMAHLAESVYKLPKIAEFAELFPEQEPKLSPNDTFILRMADAATKELYTKLVDITEKYKGAAEKFSTGTADEGRAKEYLTNLVPAASVKSIAAIINAAWEIRLKIDSWDILEDIEEDDERKREKLRVLRDLVLKSFEVYEYRKRLEGHAAKRK